MRPIPFRLLIHSATLRHLTGTDEFQHPTCIDTELSRIRIDPSTRTLKTKDNTARTYNAVCFFDCTRSRPRGAVFYLGDRLVFDGTEYEIGSIERLYDGRRLHHYEIGLM